MDCRRGFFTAKFANRAVKSGFDGSKIAWRDNSARAPNHGLVEPYFGAVSQNVDCATRSGGLFQPSEKARLCHALNK